jgi:NAD(P)H-hydrate repair Nnr-like enzyme with NAD(P)H-hydrate epimerase domain
VCTDSGVDTDTGAQQGRRQDQQQGQMVMHADRVITMMARQVARLVSSAVHTYLAMHARRAQVAAAHTTYAVLL